MADDWYETVYENKHDAINDFIKQKQTTGRSPRTLNSYSRVLKRYYHEHFPDFRRRRRRCGTSRSTCVFWTTVA
jgi:integrase/recombinase XerD